MIGVTWLFRQPRLASARYRANIPREVLMRRGVVKDGNSLVIASKHGWDIDHVRSTFKRMIMDVCDDHFKDERRNDYLKACKVADLITCNSQTMREIIKTETGREAVVIDDPYEDPELEPTLGDGLLWFGHSVNTQDLIREAPRIKYPTHVIAGYDPEKLAMALRACRLVILPTGKSMAKSANRAIKAIRFGKFPVCGELPSFAELGLGGDFITLLEDAMHRDTREEVRTLQDKIRDRFSPETVADAWEKVICG